MNAAKDSRPVDLEAVREAGRGSGGGNRPPGHMFWALVFQAVVSLAVLPLPLVLGVRRLGLVQKEGRLRQDESGDSVVEGVWGVDRAGEAEGTER
jgi:hypothetical protein